MEQGNEILCCGLNLVFFWKSLILRPPGWRWLEPSGFSSVVSSQCLWCNQECILPRKLWVLCKSMVEFWSKLLDRHKINVKCWERQWLEAVLQISCRWTDMLFSSFQPQVQPAIPVAFLSYTSLLRAHLHTVDMEPLLHFAAIMRSLKPSSATLRSHACLLSHICILQSANHDSEHKARSISAHLSLEEHLSCPYSLHLEQTCDRCISFTLTHSAAVITSSAFPLDSLYVVWLVF